MSGSGTIQCISVLGASVYAEGRKVANIALEEGGAWARKPGHVVWIGMLEPSEAELGELQRQFNLDPLAIEDAHEAHQRPKIQRYGDGLFVVARTAELIDDRIAFGETHVFVGRGYVVSVRHGPSASFARVREHCECNPAELARGESYILYQLLDFIVDNYLNVIERVQDEAERIETDILKVELTQRQVERLYTLRRDLLRLRGGVLPLVEVCRRLEHAEVMPVDAHMQLCFRDVTDHVRGVQEAIDALREMLAFAFEASLLTSQSAQTVVSRRLAAWAAILAVPTAMAGIYGMNFKHMPELEWEYGYYAVLAVVVAVCLALFTGFKRAKWL